MWADTILNEALALPEQLRREQDDARRTVSDLRVLSARNVDERLGRRVHDLEELQNRRAVVRDGRLPVRGHDELVHPARSEGRRNGVGDGEASRDVGQQLRRALGRVGALCKGASSQQRAWIRSSVEPYRARPRPSGSAACRGISSSFGDASPRKALTPM